MIVRVLYYVISIITIIYGLYFCIIGFLGIIKQNKVEFKKSKKNNFFAILIPARNEGEVIGNLIDSLLELNYPKDRYRVYVIPNNCSDNTREIVKEKLVSIIDCNIPVKTKGDVLKYTFNVLKDNKEIDAYLIFDADNVVHEDFLIHMNDCLNSGYNVAEGFRDVKNPSDNWISSSYTIFYLFQNIFFNKSRMSLNLSSSINGTGFMISKKLIDKDGFLTYTLTEDVEFAGQCALKNEKIAFVRQAITYDEYPDNFTLSFKQRKRWSAGIIECMKKYSYKLFKNYLKTKELACLDMCLVYLGPFMQIMSFITFIMSICLNIIDLKINMFILSNLIFFIITLIIELFALKYENKSFKGMFGGIFLFFLFVYSWIPINIICFFKKNTRWEEIKHSKNIKINEVNNK